LVKTQVPEGRPNQPSTCSGSYFTPYFFSNARNSSSKPFVE
jgi:hypothetical protein